MIDRQMTDRKIDIQTDDRKKTDRQNGWAGEETDRWMTYR